MLLRRVIIIGLTSCRRKIKGLRVLAGNGASLNGGETTGGIMTKRPNDENAHFEGLLVLFGGQLLFASSFSKYGVEVMGCSFFLFFY